MSSAVPDQTVRPYVFHIDLSDARRDHEHVLVAAGGRHRLMPHTAVTVAAARAAEPALRAIPDHQLTHCTAEPVLLSQDYATRVCMAGDARPPQPVPSCCEHEGILWDLAAVYPKGTRWDDVLPPAIAFDGPVVRVTDKIEGAIGH